MSKFLLTFAALQKVVEETMTGKHLKKSKQMKQETLVYIQKIPANETKYQMIKEMAYIKSTNFGSKNCNACPIFCYRITRRSREPNLSIFNLN